MMFLGRWAQVGSFPEAEHTRKSHSQPEGAKPDGNSWHRKTPAQGRKHPGPRKRVTFQHLVKGGTLWLTGWKAESERQWS